MLIFLKPYDPSTILEKISASSLVFGIEVFCVSIAYSSSKFWDTTLNNLI